MTRIALLVRFSPLVVAASLAATPAAAQTEPAPTDARVQLRVVAALAADDAVDLTRLEVETVDGVVRIGTTDIDDAAWARARAVASAVDGVRQVQMLQPAPGGDPGAIAAGAVEPTSLADAFGTATAIGTPTDAVYELPEPEGSGALDRAASGDRPRTYTVQAGDSLSVIAARTMGDGTRWPRLHEFNRNVIGPNPERLSEGMVLRIPQD